ncbi:MAG TPA: four helix bundle protein [Dehalococcoidia bacterium]|nr:four helix bundle protein [Dehalococcoidia bacterium]
MALAIESFRELRVWQASMDLVEQIYRVTGGFPRHELYGLASQMQRAAVSVPSNIAEGHTREHRAEYLHHISIAQASLAELQTQLEISVRLGYLTPEAARQPLVDMASLAKQLYSLRNALTRPRGRRPPTPNPQHPTPVTE